MTKEPTYLLSLKDEEFKSNLKQACIVTGKTMKDYMQEAIEVAVLKDLSKVKFLK